jgi:hypothetical protein
MLEDEYDLVQAVKESLTHRSVQVGYQIQHFQLNSKCINVQTKMNRFLTFNYTRLLILKSIKFRTTFLCDPAQRIVFPYTPKYSSLLNQIEIWFRIWVCQLLR